MLKKLYNQKGVVHLLVLILVVLGIIAGVFLVTHPQIFKSKAGNDQTRITINDGATTTSSPHVKVTLTYALSAFLPITPIGPASTPAFPSSGLDSRGLEFPYSTQSAFPVASVICEYPAPPVGCHYEGLKMYPPCGAQLVCPSASPFPSCQPVVCPLVQPQGCEWVGRNSCSCGNLVCSSPKPTCMPRPACLDAKPVPCTIPEPAGGFCNNPLSFPTAFRLANDDLNSLNSAQEQAFDQNSKVVDWVLSSGNGQKTVYAQFKVNGVWTPPYSASITLNVPDITKDYKVITRNDNLKTLNFSKGDKILLLLDNASYFSYRNLQVDNQNVLAITQGLIYNQRLRSYEAKFEAKSNGVANINVSSSPFCRFRFICPLGIQDLKFTINVGSGEGMHCGGFIANPPICPPGFVCKLGSIPDIGGTCVPAPIPKSCKIDSDCQTSEKCLPTSCAYPSFCGPGPDYDNNKCQTYIKNSCFNRCISVSTPSPSLSPQPTPSTSPSPSSTSQASLNNLPCNSLAVDVSPTAPSPGSKVIISANALPCLPGEYQILLQSPNGNWTYLQHYSSNSNYTIDTSSLSSGYYEIEVDARQKGSNASYQVYTLKSFLLSSTSEKTPGNGLRCSSVLVSSNQTSPTSIGIPVTFTANATPCTPAEYQMLIKYPVTGWKVIKPYNSNSSFTLDTNGLTAGDYTLEIDSRAIGSQEGQQAFSLYNFTLK